MHHQRNKLLKLVAHPLLMTVLTFGFILKRVTPFNLDLPCKLRPFFSQKSCFQRQFQQRLLTINHKTSSFRTMHATMNLLPSPPDARGNSFSEQVLSDSVSAQIYDAIDQKQTASETLRSSMTRIRKLCDIGIHLIHGGRLAEGESKLKEAVALLGPLGLETTPPPPPLTAAAAVAVAAAAPSPPPPPPPPRVHRDEQIGREMEQLVAGLAFLHFLRTGRAPGAAALLPAPAAAAATPAAAAASTAAAAADGVAADGAAAAASTAAAAADGVAADGAAAAAAAEGPGAGAGLLTDAEYLGGLMGLTHELQKYAVARATVQDVKSVVMAKRVIDAIYGKLMEFDFRNGPLRKKYDSVKYQLRRLEDLLYELSLVGLEEKGLAEESQDEEGTLLPPVLDAAELEAVRGRMEAYDATREHVIKATRDVQKLSKNAIYSLHRGDRAKAEKQLAEAFTLTKALEPTILQVPTLRYGSYASAMEEYAEARLFQAWLAHRRLPALEELGVVEPLEYLGGLMDLTGELGREAVARATRRDAAGVAECRDTDLKILELLLQLPLGKMSKKMDMVNSGVRKLDNVLYELSLVKAGKGTRGPPSSITEQPSKGEGGGNRMEEEDDI